jgi:glycosyltransferase involved in cell wall biosynthesis
MKYSILVPVLMQHDYQYNLTVACINNIHAFSFDYEIILLHSMCEYRPDVARLLRPGEDKYVPYKTNPSQAKALNKGIKMARGEYIILIGNDNMVHQNWLSEIEKRLDDPACQILACTVDRYPPDEYQKLIDKYEIHNGIKFGPFSYYNFQGVTIPKKVFKEIGLLDENLPFYFWERDLNFRLDEAKYKCGSVLTSYMTTPMSMTRMNKTLPEGVHNWWTDESNEKEIEYFEKKWGRHP